MEIKSDKTALEIISSIKVLLSVVNGQKDAILETLLSLAYDMAVGYTRQEQIPSAILVRMVCEDYAKEAGIAKRSRGSMSEEYLDGYSKPLLSSLKKLRKLRAV